MTVEKIVDTAATTETALEAWVKPEIVSFDAVRATQAAFANPGDSGNNNS